MRHGRTGFYFSFDALIALTLVSVAFFVVFNTGQQSAQGIDAQGREAVRADAAAESALQVAIRQQTGNALTPAERTYFEENTVLTAADFNKSVLDAIAVLWASNESVEARNLTRLFFDGLIPERYDYRLRMLTDTPETIYNTSMLGSEAAFVTRGSRLISGVSRNKPTQGFIARATLREATKHEKQNVFFGGYVGDGNITVNVSLPDLDTVLNVTLEGDFSGPFNLSFNGVPAGTYAPTGSNLSADEYHVCSSTAYSARCAALQNGDNLLHLNFTTGNASIGGGFFEIKYNRTTGLNPRGGTYIVRDHRLPGIDGVINLFSSFYVPGDLQSMEAYLHYTAGTGTVFMSIGNATVYEQEADGEFSVRLDNASLFGNLSTTGMHYDVMSQATIPFRVGVTRTSLETGEAGAIDAVATTDLSGSMDSQCAGGGGSQCKIKKAKNATKQFIDIILDTPAGRVGLTGFNDFIKSYHELDTNGTDLKEQVDDYDGQGGTCVGCGIIRSVNTLIMKKIPQPLIEQGSSWTYTTGSAPNTSWTGLSFNTSDWGTGSAPIGDGGLALTQVGENETYRFRHVFSFDTADWYQPYLSLRHTGRATVYLNGQELYRSDQNHTGNYWDTHLGRWAEKTGLWHKSEQRALWNGSAWYFGQEEVARYSTGVREFGNLTTPLLNLSNVSNPQLVFSHWLELDDNKDDAYVEVNDGTGWAELANYRRSTNQWENESFDLSGYATDTVRIRFRFEAQNAKGKNEDYEGWYVDGVQVAGFHSDVVNRSLFNDGKNVLAVELAADPQPVVNGSINVSSFTGAFTNTTDTGSGLQLDGETTGTFVSDPIDAGTIVEWTGNTTATTTPTDTNLTITYETNRTGTWTPYTNLSMVPNARFIRFTATLRANETGRTPTLHWHAVDHARYGIAFDAELTADTVRTPSMLVLSDGKSNQITAMDNVPDHDGDGDVDASDHSIEAGCRAHQKYRADVHTVAIGGNANPDELNLTAQCGGGNFYNATIDTLVQVYEQIAQDIIQASFEGQQITVTSGDVNQTLHPDSYLRLNYTREQVGEFGQFSLTQLSDRFGGGITSPKTGSFTIPSGVTVSEAQVTSYSSKYWTDRLHIKNASGSFEPVFRLWQYDDNYDALGDPFLIHIPVDHVQPGVNELQVDTALNRTDTYGGSPDDRVIYTLEVDGTVGYGDAFSKSMGGTYTFSTIGGPVTITVGNATDPWNASNDAIDNATVRLVDKLDVDGDGVVDVKLSSDDFTIDTQNTGGIEWLWGPATITIEVWR